MLVADPDEGSRRGLADLLAGLPEVGAVLEARDVPGLWAAAAGTDLVILDASLVEEGLATIGPMNGSRTTTGLIVLAEANEPELAHACLVGGALSFLLKGSDPRVVRDAVRAALEGRGILDREIVRPVLDRYAALLDEARRRDRDVIASLAAAVEAKDVVTSTHLQAVFSLSRELASLVDRDLAESEDFLFGCLLHDIGKIGVPEQILGKPGPLDEEEWMVMRRHPQTGARVIRPLDLPPTVLDIVLHHHERWDGGGYPDRLAGEEIPLCARIFSVCDAYDAMTADRPYRAALSPRVAFERIVLEAGQQFDPEIVGVLESAVSDGTIELGDGPAVTLDEVPTRRRILGAAGR